MARKKGFLESRGFKLFMKYLYGIGAAVVIGGALFKIMHWPGANQMLIAGMGTEVLVFFVSAFEPLHEELDWAKVYPQLAEDSDDEFLLTDGDGDEFNTDEALAMADEGLKDIEITPDLFESLSGSIKGLQDNVGRLGEISDATVATNEYAAKVRTATESMDRLNDNYTSTVDAMSRLSSSVGSAAEDAEAYHHELSKVNQSLASLNAVYEMELQDAQAHIKTVNTFYENLGNAMNNMVEAAKDAEAYRNEVASLTANLQNLNRIYGGMLSAMSGGNA